MKKTISLILCFCFVFGMFGILGFAEEAPFYSLTFIADGGEFENGEEERVFYMHEGDNISDILPPTRNAYNFKGWNTNLPDKMPASNLVFTAVWEKISGADPEDGKIPIEKVELNIYINRVYVDVSLSDCWLQVKGVDTKSKYSYDTTLQKSINGEWTNSFTKDNDEKIGTGKYRWKVTFSVEWDYQDDYKIVPGVTKAYIDGVDYGSLDSDCAIYTNQFEITEKDKRPETIVIKEVRVDGFREPKVGEPLLLNEDDLSFFDIDGKYVAIVVYNIVESRLNGNKKIVLYPEKEIAEEGVVYTYKLVCITKGPYYEFSKNAKLYLNGKKYNLVIANDFLFEGVNLANAQISFFASQSFSILGFFFRIIDYIKTFFNSIIMSFK